MYRLMTANTPTMDGECDSCHSSEYSTMTSNGLFKRTDLLCQLQELSLDDKELLRAYWHHLSKRKEEIAVEIFILIFKQCPETKKLFYFIDSEQPASSSKRMKDDHAFQFHALRFIQIIESMIDHLDEPSSVEPVLHSLGQIHLRFRDKFGFQPYYWSVFCECTLFVFRERLKHRTDDIDRAVTLWRLVLGAIKQKMRQGFNTGDRKRRDLLSSNMGQASGSTTQMPQRSNSTPESRSRNPDTACLPEDILDEDFSDIGVQVTNEFII